MARKLVLAAQGPNRIEGLFRLSKSYRKSSIEKMFCFYTHTPKSERLPKVCYFKRSLLSPPSKLPHLSKMLALQCVPYALIYLEIMYTIIHF